MAFPIIPRLRSGSSGNPSSLYLGELAVNTHDGSVYLGADAGVVQIGVPIAAGTVVTEHTGDGTTTAFTFSGYNGTADGGYIVSVGGIDQPPSVYSVSATNGGTLTFNAAPASGEIVSIRAMVAGSGGGGTGDATSIQGRAVASTAPSAGQALVWNGTQWAPATISGGGSTGGTVTYTTVGQHYFSVPANARWARLQATAGTGANGTDGTDGVQAYLDESLNFVPSQNGTNGTDGAAGKSIKVANVLVAAGGLGGGKGWGGGAGGSPTIYVNSQGENGQNGLGPEGGQGGYGQPTGDPSNGIGSDGTTYGNGTGGAGGAGGITDYSGSGHGGAGGAGGKATNNAGGSGGGGGGGAYNGTGTSGILAATGQPGKGGVGGTGLSGESIDAAFDLTSYAGGQLLIEITEGAGSASITITY